LGNQGSKISSILILLPLMVDFYNLHWQKKFKKNQELIKHESEKNVNLATKKNVVLKKATL
jgi:hypothetical protein